MKVGNIVNEYKSKRNVINNKESEDASVRDSRTVEENEEESKMDDKEESSGGDEIESEKEASRYCMLSPVIVSYLHASLCYSLLRHV